RMFSRAGSASALKRSAMSSSSSGVSENSLMEYLLRLHVKLYSNVVYRIAGGKNRVSGGVAGTSRQAAARQAPLEWTEGGEAGLQRVRAHEGREQEPGRAHPPAEGERGDHEAAGEA